MCDETTPPYLCTNFTFNTSTKICTLLPIQPALQSYDVTCVSGGAGERYPNMQCRTGGDCNDQGTCTNGKCVCSPDFSGAMCQNVNPVDGNCTIQDGVYTPGSKLFNNDVAAATVEDCCYECTKFPLCNSWTFNSTAKACTLLSSPSTPLVLSPVCTSGGPPARSLPTCDLSHTKAGTCLTGTMLGKSTSKSISDCCSECGGLMLCSQWSFATDTGTCSLYPSDATVDPNVTSCLSGHTGGGFLPCRASTPSDCNLQGTCSAGSCVCTGGYSGGACEKVPKHSGGCTLQAGVAYTSPAIFGGAPATSPGDCCYLCNQHNGLEVPLPCTHYTWNSTAKFCTLHHSPSLTQRSVQPTCIAGSANGHQNLKCRTGNSADCNNQGSCSGGNCVCKGGYSGDFCQYVPKEKCKIHAGQCLSGNKIGGAGADNVGQCCHECTRACHHSL